MMLIRNAEIRGHGRADVRIAADRIVSVAPPGGGIALNPGERVIDARGSLLLPGLHDHHIHLAALSATRTSVWCGPPQVSDPDHLAAVLAAPGDGWIRGIGYHDNVMGLPTARELDRLVPDRPLRIQHRSGRLWLLNTMALELLLASAPAPAGLDADAGHLFDEDAWLRRALASAPPDLGAVSAELARLGITGVTDMSPSNDIAIGRHLADQMTSGALVQQTVLAGTLELASAEPGPWRLGPAKLHLHQAALPKFDEAVRFISTAHEQARAVAVHCVSEIELVFALAVIEAAGPTQGDRIEHASVASDELVSRIAELGLQVVTQPHFVAERGDAYLRDVEPRHHPELYRQRAFLTAGVILAGGSDAPFGSADPWAAMAAAVARRTRAGAVVGREEALSADEALALYLKEPLDLTRERRIETGAPADLCLLDRPWEAAKTDLGAVRVAATWISGRLVHEGVNQPPV